jgi:hypothetical protein
MSRRAIRWGQREARDLSRQMTGSAMLYIPLASFVDADGDPLAKFADGAVTTPGFNLADSEAFGIRWNNHATPAPILTNIALPEDFDDAEASSLVILASKVGATVGDAVTFTCTAFVVALAALHDAGTNLGGASTAMVGNAATKTVQKCTLTIAEAGYGTGEKVMNLTIKPTDGTLGTDDVIIHGVWLKYVRKPVV